MRLSALLFCCVCVAAAAQNQDLATEVKELREMIQRQQREIDELKRLLNERGVTAAPPVAKPKLEEPKAEPTPGPPALRIGDVLITPIGFVDLTAVFRDTAPGTSIGTNFATFPYRTASDARANLSEFRLSPQNSRISARVETTVHGAKVTGYVGMDFLGATGNPPTGTVGVTTNGYPMRMRLFWVDVQKGRWEMLGGQTWSLLTPSRRGVTPLPTDIFYSQAIDVNYTLGLPCCRFPEFRVVYRPDAHWSLAGAIASPEQYTGGNITLPAGFTTSYNGQLSDGTLALTTPNRRPDFIAKLVWEDKRTHLELAGISRRFRTYAASSGQHFTANGLGVSANANVELFRDFRLFSNNYWSDGGGRYLFGTAPDLVVRADGSLSPVKAMGAMSGFEYTRGNWFLYSYYGGVYVARNTDGLSGYGYQGSPASQNRSIQEITFGFNRTFWRDPRWGVLQLMGQYAYLTRHPWYASRNAPTSAYMNEVFVNLRYALPGR